MNQTLSTQPLNGDPYISRTIFSQIDWQPSDVMISVGMKQGTTWLLNIVHQLRTGGDDTFACLTDECPSLDFPDYPGQPDQERLAVWEKGVFHKYPFRIFKTHTTPPTLPYRSDMKYLISIRNPKDTLISYYFFWQNTTQEHRAVWGERVAPYSSLADSVDHFLAHQWYWRFANGWLPYRHAPNVLLLHYADLKRDMIGNIHRIADFLNLTPSSAQWPSILEKCSFEWMRANTNKFDILTVTSRYSRFQSGSLTRTGGIGEHKMLLSPEEEGRVQSLHEQLIPDPALRAWCDRGGVLP